MTPNDLPQSLDIMTPLELVTHLITCLKLADGRMDYEEREAWANALSDLFPEHDPERAVSILQSASQKILEMNSMERTHYASTICEALKSHYSEEELEFTIYPRLESIADADGMVLSSETDLLNVIKSSFGISDDNLDE